MINFSVCTQRISCLAPADQYFKKLYLLNGYPMKAGFLSFSAETFLLLYILNPFWLVKNWSRTYWKQSLSHFVSVFSPHTVRESINIIYKSLTIGLLIWNLHCIYTGGLEQCILTLKWSRGVPMDPKISFRALARKRKVIGRSPSLTLSNLRFFWWQKNLHRPCASSAN